GPLSPLVRKMARENNIDLSKVKGTGAGGRITKQDLDSYLASGPSRPSAEMATIPQTVNVPPPPAQQQQQPQAPPPQPAPVATRTGEMPATRVEPMTTMRQKIAEHMVFSKHT